MIGRLFGRAARVRVHVLVKGRIGPEWWDLDRTYALEEGATLTALLDAIEREGHDLRAAIAASPHMARTIMINGERCPLETHASRPLADGDEVYLLAPIAGG